MNPYVSFFGGVALGAICSWLITRFYYLKGSREQKAEIPSLQEALRPKNTLADFARQLETSGWTQTYIDNVSSWICNADNTFQIRMGDNRREFRERWTMVYPDSHGSVAYPVFLTIGGTVIKELTFISMDGGRISVPMPEIRPVDGENVEYFWNLYSLEVKVARVIGAYYIYASLEGVARKSKVALVEK